MRTIDAREEDPLHRQLEETCAILMVGDGVVTFMEARRHARLWTMGPAWWREFNLRLARHPAIARALAAIEVGVGLWWAHHLRPPGDEGAA